LKFKESIKPTRHSREGLLSDSLTRTKNIVIFCIKADKTASIGGFMTPSMLRQLWSLVETTQASTLVNLDDASLVQCLLKQFNKEAAINGNEAALLRDYICSRISLIRDLAEARLSGDASA
jgi:hypothetical protein